MLLIYMTKRMTWGTLRLNLDRVKTFQIWLDRVPKTALHFSWWIFAQSTAVFVFVWRRRTSRSVIFWCGIWRPCRGACLSLNITNMNQILQTYHINYTVNYANIIYCICGAATANFADSRVKNLCGLSADSVASLKRTGWNGQIHRFWSLLPRGSCQQLRSKHLESTHFQGRGSACPFAA
jgi:hypothetical protein